MLRTMLISVFASSSLISVFTSSDLIIVSAPAAAAAQGAGVVGRTARSVVCAAVINAGIEVVMHGAGAVSSILGDGQKELFGDIDLGDAE